MGKGLYRVHRHKREVTEQGNVILSDLIRSREERDEIRTGQQEAGKRLLSELEANPERRQFTNTSRKVRR